MNRVGNLSIGLFIVGCLILFAMASNLIFSPKSTELNLKQRLHPPSTSHWLGTDQRGADVLSLLGQGAKTSLTISISVVFIGLIIGLMLGSLAGWLGGGFDLWIMALVDFVFAFPGFLLILALAAFFQASSILTLIFILSLTIWASFARLVRGEVLHLKEKEFVLNSKATGAGSLRILCFYIWPNLLGSLLVQATFTLASVVLIESSLSFLGVGVPPSTPSWGSMLNSGRNYLLEAPYLSLFPGLALFLLVIGINLIGEGLRIQFDPEH